MNRGPLVLIVEADDKRANRYADNVAASGGGYLIAKTVVDAFRTLDIAPTISELCIAGLYYTKHAGIAHLKELQQEDPETG